jgi:hypothetical protein
VSEAPAMNANDLRLPYLRVGFRVGIPETGLDLTLRLLATGSSTGGSPEESCCERTKGSKGEGQILWTDLKGLIKGLDQFLGAYAFKERMPTTEAGLITRNNMPPIKRIGVLFHQRLSFFCYV